MTGAALDAEARAALDEAPCGLLRTDPDGRILLANRTFCEWVGYTEAELRTRCIADLLTVGGRIFQQTHWMPLMQMQGSVAELKLDVQTASGRTIPMVFNARRQSREGKAVDDVAVFVARDRDKYERELLQSRRRLESLVAEAKALQEAAQDRALLAEQMMGIVSHDLRNSLQTIQMGALVLTRGQVTSNQLAVLSRISRATDRAHRLIADLLDFTSARLGKGIAIHPERIEAHVAIAEVVEELRDAFPGRELVHLAEGAGDCLVDADRLAQVVGNLVGNAMAYGEPASPVQVCSTVGPDALLVSVHNRGAPIPAEMQARLFQPMVRGRQEGGAVRSVGLGLFIVQEIAKAHGGQVAVSSSDEAGTTFSVTFPRRLPGKPEGPVNANRGPHPDSSDGPHPPRPEGPPDRSAGPGPAG